MEPTLCDGDWLLVDPLAFRRSPPVASQLVVAEDSRVAGRSVVKRVKAVGSDGSVTLAGDHPAHNGDELRVAWTDVAGRPWFRYWPLRRLGRVR